MQRIAVIDIGSTAIRCTIADVIAPDALMIVADERTQTRLASGLVASGMLAEDRMDESIQVIVQFLGLVASYKVDLVRAIATAAVRSASNGKAFVERVLCQTGLRVDIIDGAYEARLAVASAAAAFDLPDPVCIADIGGGSLEIVVLRGGAPEVSTSLPLGAAATSNRLPRGEDPPPAPALALVSASIRRELLRVLGASPAPVSQAVCSGGAITSLVGAAVAHRGGDPLDIHGATASIDEVRAVAARVAASTLEERGRIPGIPRYRAQTVLAGSLVMLGLFDLLGTETVLANRRGIREGLLLEMAHGLHEQTDASADA